MMNIIVGLIFMALGVCIVLRPRVWWWFRWGWLWNREPNRVELLFARMVGVGFAATGLFLALADYLYRIF